MAALLACGGGAGWSAENQHPLTPAIGLAQLDPGAIVVTSSPEPALFSFAAGTRTVETAAEGASRAVRDVLSTPSLGNSQLETAVGAIECLAAPFAAAYGAISSARLKMSSNQLAAAERDLGGAMGVMADQQHLRQAVFRGAGERTHRRLISLDPGAIPPAGTVVSARFETQVEELRLQRAGADESKLDLRIRARARLVRASDGAVLGDRPYDYRSGGARFIAWTDLDAVANVARTGYRQIAEDMVRDFFAASESEPIVLGRGHPEASRIAVTANGGAAVSVRTSKAPAAAGLAPSESASPSVLPAPAPSPPLGSPATPETPAASFQAEGRPGVSVVGGVPPSSSAAVFSVESPPYLRRQEPEPPEVPTDTQWDLDGLEDDSNMVVQTVAGLAIVPVALWDKTLGALGERTRKRFEAVNGRLQEVVWNLKPQRVVAGELVRLLGPLPSKPAGGLGAAPDAPARGDPSSAPSPDSPAPALERPDPDAVVVRTGTGTAAEIRVTDVDLDRRPGLRARVALRLEVRATLVRLSDGQELCSWPLRYLGEERRLEDWSPKARRSYREELAHGCREMAGAVARGLVSRGVVSPSPAAGSSPILRSKQTNHGE